MQGSEFSSLRDEKGTTEEEEEDEAAREEELSGGYTVCEIPADEELSLREWLDKPERPVDPIECLHIFKQVVEAVSLAHSQGIVIVNIRPSCFLMSSLNHISFIESASCSSGSESFGEGSSCRAESSPERLDQKDGIGAMKEDLDDATKAFPLKKVLVMEMNWYTSPEEAAEDLGTLASDIYRLGVFLFELFCSFSSMDEKLGTMANLRHRVLPPQLLLKWPKQASFCLWLLHPQPNSRPKMSEILQSELLNEPKDSFGEREVATKLRDEIENQELLLEFLLELQQKKQEEADKLQDTIQFLSTDIEQVRNYQSVMKKGGDSNSALNNNDEHLAFAKVDQTSAYHFASNESSSSGSRKRVRPVFPNSEVKEHNGDLVEGPRSETHAALQENVLLSRSSRLMKHIGKLEIAYFLTKFRMMKSSEKLTSRKFSLPSSGGGSLSRTEASSIYDLDATSSHGHEGKSEWIDSFLKDLCNYLSFSKLKVRAEVKQGDLLNSSNLICSLGFDRDKEFFATAGVNKKIKIFECNSILNKEHDLHYPVAEMVGRSKFSSICWNGYIKSQIASSDFEGVVQVWDATRGQVLVEMGEHERRIWSVDFSLVDPTKLASGSDDGAVKLWNINQAESIGTIRTKANVCSVQFAPDSSHSLAIGSADHNIYCYDLRNFSAPYRTLVGHTKTVSYVKFLDSATIVSASTDNTLKLWDLSLCTSRVVNDALRTFTGHTNVKNFVGLSLSDGYIATGSETNEVFVYHKAFPMPILSYKFSCTDPISGREEVDDTAHFISCVCWQGRSSTLLAANSSGNIKLLEMT
ncbi:hypothetical protein J5N97_019402 [Dioscorea zingiberensis]|uniref:Protein kinase domain-containing protein n=1 Tax=Dioscorea zingiberensis TaxID=325984 RepID=A0A9D5CE22_9LILI|nr:hypothetical protein J5N97_019402 [Dioscorea zingiberensis]